MIVRVSDLSPEQKAIFESLLGRAVHEREHLQIDAHMNTPSDEEREKAWDDLRDYLEERAAKRPPEEEELILEALRSTRPNYRPVD